MTSRGPRLNVLLGALAIATAGINEPRPPRREPIDPPPPPRPPEPPAPPPEPYRPHASFHELAMPPRAEPRELTRDEFAAEAKRQRKAAKAMRDAERRGRGKRPPWTPPEDWCCTAPVCLCGSDR